MNSFNWLTGKRHCLKATVFALVGMVAFPTVSIASTYVSATAQTFGTTTANVKDSKAFSGGNGQEVQYHASADTFEIGHLASATAYADATEGVLKASLTSAAIATANTRDTGRAQAYATARWDDTITVNAGSALNGSKGYVTATIDVSGTYGGTTGLSDQWDTAEHFEQVKILGTGIDATGTPSSYGCLGWSLCDYHDYGTWGANNQFANIPSVISLKIPVTFGLETRLTYVIDLTDLAFADSYAGASGISASAFVDYGHTMSWGGISGVYDANGVLVSSFTTTSGSGFNYLNAAPVPEPKNYSLLLAGLGLVLVIAGRSKQN